MSTKHSEIKILILGGSGLLGSSLMPILRDNGHEIEFHGRTNAAKYNADISNAGNAFKLLNLISPSVIVNLMGLTDVDRCEAKPNEAFLANVRTIENIVGWIKQDHHTCYLVHISTDQVYDGASLHNEDQVTLTNYYAFSKYAGELAASNVPSAILRTNFFGRSHCAKRASLTDWIYHSLANNNSIQVFDDVLFSPLAMATLSEMIELCIRIKPVGVFNLGSHDGMSKADFAFTFAEELHLSNHTMKRTTTDQVTFLKTYRPKDMRMNSAKFENIMGIKLPKLKDEIKRVAREYCEIT